MQYISRKMQKMVDDIKENKGDLSMRLEVTGGDEIGSVGRNVNAFINTLQDIMASITDSAAEMNRVILEVDNKVCLSNDNSNDISSAMEELSASMEAVTETVSSITDNGTGDYTVNFTTPMEDANYSVSISVMSPASGWGTQSIGQIYKNDTANGSLLTNSIRVSTGNALAATYIDFSTVAVSIFR